MKIRKSIEYFVHLLGANFLSQVIGVVALSYYTRIFSKEELAILPATIMLGGIANLIFNFGFFPTMIKTVPSMIGKKDKEIKKFFSTIFVFSLLSGIILMWLTFFFSEEISLWIFKNPSGKNSIKIISFSLIFFSLWQFISYVLRSLSKFKELSRFILLQNMLRVLLIISLSFFFREFAIIIAILVSIFVSTILAFYTVRKYFFPFNGFYNVVRLLKDSLPFYFEGYIMYFQREGDNLVITTFLGANMLATYFVAKKIYLFVYGVLSSLSDVLTSQISKFKNEISKYEEKLNEISTAYVFLVIPIFSYLLSFSPFLLHLVAGENYDEAVLPGTILGLVPLIQYFFGLNFGINVFLLDKSVKRLQYTLLNSVVLIFSLFLLVRILSLEGVILSRIITPIISGLYVIYLSRRVNISFSIQHFKLFKVGLFSIILFTTNLGAYIIKLDVFLLVIFNIVLVVISLLIVHFNFSEEFYSSVNSIFAIKVNDPLNFLFKRKNK